MIVDNMSSVEMQQMEIDHYFLGTTHKPDFSSMIPAVQLCPCVSASLSDQGDFAQKRWAMFL